MGAIRSPAPIYMNYDGIAGQCVASHHPGWAEGESLASCTSSNPLGGISYNAVTVRRKVDLASPELFLRCASNTPISRCVVEFLHTNGSLRAFYRVEFCDVLVTRVCYNDAGAAPEETLDMTFARMAWSYTAFDDTGRPAGEQATGWDELSRMPDLSCQTPPDSDGDGLDDVIDPDDDGDGVPDIYETSNSLDPYRLDAHLDADQDTFSNLEEFWAGTQANNPASYLRVVFLQTSPSMGLLGWLAASNKQYIVESAPSPGGPYGFYQFVPSPGEGVIQYPVPVAAGRLFYRVRLPVP
jgi:type VI protein secretion system component Hcp